MRMKSFKTALICTSIFFRRKLSIILIAFMIGVSNVILEETRTVHDTKKEVVLKEDQDEGSQD